MALREIELENRLQVFAMEARACASFAYTELAFRHELRADRDLRKQVDAHRTFWRQVRAALRTALFSSLARLYDESRNSNSAGQLLRPCERHLELFSRAAHSARQIEAGVPHVLTAERAGTIFEPHPGDLQPLFVELDRMRRFYHRIVQPAQARFLRSGSEAADYADDASDDDLAGSEFEELALFPLRLHRALDGLYREGRPPVLPEVPLEIEEVLSGRGAGWEHVGAARSAAAFLRLQTFPAAAPAIAPGAGYSPESAAVAARAGAGPA
ncbi:MAG TPA: hypothetical protein VFV10_20630 [Gammaproteobacteria bacterium]|nr:hypothetical protein [Gammaproteobacteria bacterium]